MVFRLFPVLFFAFTASWLNSPAAMADEGVDSKTIGGIQLTDFAGNKIFLDKPAQRIVALSPHIAENIFSAGAGKKLVATVDYSDFPAQAATIKRIGAFNTLSLEVILAVNPDLVIAWGSGNGPQIISQLRSLGFAVYVDEPITLQDVMKSIGDIGLLAGTTEISEKVVSDFEEKLSALRSANEKKSPVNVLYEVWHDPLQTLNQNHIISSIINLCQGENIFSDAIPHAPKVSVEAVIARNPDVIVASGLGEEEPSWLPEWQRWPSINAVKNNSVFYIPPDIIQRHTTRILEGASLMCEHLDSARKNQQ